VEDKSKFSLETWEDLILRLLSETIRLVNDPVWTKNLGVQYTEQLAVYESDADLKRVCMKHLGLVLQKTDEKRFIRESLATLFESTNYKEPLEREGCAQVQGLCCVVLWCVYCWIVRRTGIPRQLILTLLWTF
jgi:hypothetical protein